MTGPEWTPQPVDAPLYPSLGPEHGPGFGAGAPVVAVFVSGPTPPTVRVPGLDPSLVVDDDAEAQANLDADADAEPSAGARWVIGLQALLGRLFRRRPASAEPDADADAENDSALDAQTPESSRARPHASEAPDGTGDEHEDKENDESDVADPPRMRSWRPSTWGWETRVGVAAVVSFLILIGVFVSRRAWVQIPALDPATNPPPLVQLPNSAAKGDDKAGSDSRAAVPAPSVATPPAPVIPPIVQPEPASPVGPGQAAGPVSTIAVVSPPLADHDSVSPVANSNVLLASEAARRAAADASNEATPLPLIDPSSAPPAPALVQTTPGDGQEPTPLPTPPTDAPPLPTEGTTPVAAAPPAPIAEPATLPAPVPAQAPAPMPVVAASPPSPAEIANPEQPAEPAKLPAMIEPIPAPAPVAPAPAPPPAPPTPTTPDPVPSSPLGPSEKPVLQPVPPDEPVNQTAGAGAESLVIPNSGRRPGAASSSSRDDDLAGPASSGVAGSAARRRVPDGPAIRDEPSPGASRSGEYLHKVLPNESFYTISRDAYGSGRFYKALHKANQDQIPDITKPLYIGTVLRVPPGVNLDPSLIDPPAVGEPSDGPTVSRVSTAPRSGDSDGEFPSRRSIRPTPRPSKTTTPEPRLPTYRVRREVETLRGIARDTLGDSNRASEILDLNRDQIDSIKSPLKPNMTLTLPEDAILGRRPQ